MLLLLDRGDGLSSLGLGRIELGLSERSLGGLGGGSNNRGLLNWLLDLRDGSLLGGSSRDEVSLLLLVRGTLDLLEEGAEDGATLGGLRLLCNLVLLLDRSRGNDRCSSLGLDRSRGSGLSNDRGGSRLSLQLILGLGDVRGDDGSGGRGLANLRGNRLLLLDLRLSNVLIGLVLLTEETTEDTGTLARLGAALALGSLLLVLLLSIRRGAAGGRTSTDGASGLSDGSVGFGRPGSINALLRGGYGSGR
jgi:hypothetical protein